MTDTTTAISPQSSPKMSSPRPSKGRAPSHRLLRISGGGNTRDFEEVGAPGPHKDGKGFSIKIKGMLNPGDELMIRTSR